MGVGVHGEMERPGVKEIRGGQVERDRRVDRVGTGREREIKGRETSGETECERQRDKERGRIGGRGGRERERHMETETEGQRERLFCKLLYQA